MHKKREAKAPKAKTKEARGGARRGNSSFARWRVIVVMLFITGACAWLVAAILGEVYVDNSLSVFQTLQRHQVVLSWLVLAAFCVEGWWPVVIVIGMLGVVCVWLPFYMGVAALVVGYIIWWLGRRWPLWGMMGAAAFWTLGALGTPLLIRGASSLMMPAAGPALVRRFVHWQELLLQIDLNPIWGVGWGQAPLLSQNCLLQPFTFPHHSVLQLWLEGGLFWVTIVWAVGILALVSLWPMRGRAAPFWGWLAALTAFGQQGALWHFGWLYGVLITGVTAYQLCLASMAMVQKGADHVNRNR